MKRAALLLLLFLSGCYTNPQGKKVFNPWEAAKREDASVDVFLDKHDDMPIRNPKSWDDN